jgi:hypothetical protein
MVRDTGFEPVTPSVSGRCSTTELTAQTMPPLQRRAKLGRSPLPMQPLFLFLKIAPRAFGWRVHRTGLAFKTRSMANGCLDDSHISFDEQISTTRPQCARMIKKYPTSVSCIIEYFVRPWAT